MVRDDVPENLFEDLNRKGALTEKDRKLLLGMNPHDNDHNEGRQWRRFIQRGRGTLLDIHLMFHTLSRDQRRELIMDETGHLIGQQNLYNPDADVELSDVYYEEELNAVVSLIAFAFLLADDINLSFEDLVKIALGRVSDRLYPGARGMIAHSVSIDTQAGVNVDEIIESLEDEDASVSEHEFIQLVRFLLDDFDGFCEQTADIELPDLDTLAEDTHLSRAESLVLFAREETENATLDQAIAEGHLHPEVQDRFFPIVGPIAGEN